MLIKPIPIFQDNYVWMIINPQSQSAIAVDPGDDTQVINFLETNRLQLEAILITHHHADHSGGVLGLVSKYLVNVYGPKHESIPGVTHRVSEPDTLVFNTAATILDIPGHTLGHIAYYFPGVLFCGDTLFSAGCGRVFEGTAAQMYYSLQKIAMLPQDTKIYCAHEYTLNNLKFAELVEPSNKAIPEKLKEVLLLRQDNHPTLPTSVYEEKQINPFLRCHIDEIAYRVQQKYSLDLINEIQVFDYLRRWKDEF